MNYYYDDEDEELDDQVLGDEELEDDEDDEEQQQQDSGDDSSSDLRDKLEEELKKRNEQKNGDDNKPGDDNKKGDQGNSQQGKKDSDGLDPNKSAEGNQSKPQNGTGTENGSGQSSGSSPSSGGSSSPQPGGGTPPAGAEQAGNAANTANTANAANAANAANVGAAGAEAGAAGAAGAGAGAGAGAAGAGAGAGAAAGAAGAGVGAALAYVLFWVILVIVIIIILVGLIMFILTAPGMVTEKLKAFFIGFGQQLASYFLGANTAEMVEKQQVYDILDYLETMGYDLKGYGFISADADDEDSNYDYQQGVVRNPDTGQISEAYSDIIFQYIVSDNYAYTVKNFNTTAEFSGIFGFFETTFKNMISNADLFNLIDESEWGEGLLTLRFENGDDYNHNAFDELFGWETTWDYIDVDVASKTMKIRRGWGANFYTYNLDGWTGRYSMPLEFLLSVHIATMKPDLASEMVNTFPTDVEIKLRDISDGTLTSAYKVGDKWMTNSEVEMAVNGFENDNFFKSIIAWFDNLTTTDKEMAALFALGLDHVCEGEPDACKFDETVDKTETTTDDEGNESTTVVTDEDGNPVQKVAEFSEKCREHAKKIIDLLDQTKAYHFQTYMPYITRVKDHWFRDVYFQLTADEVKNLNLTRIDLDYETLTNERWTAYETWPDGSPEAGNYKLYIYDESKSDGIGALYQDDADGDGIKGTQEDIDYANEKGKQEDENYEEIRVIKKQIKATAEDLEDDDVITLESDGSWSAYKIEDKNNEVYKRVYPDADENTEEGKLYYKEDLNDAIVQKDDGVRGVTNKTIKDMFLNRYYFNYNGTTETANIIKELRDKLDMSYGHIDDSKLDNEYTVTIKTPEYDNSGKLTNTITEDKKVKVKDYANKVSLTQDSLAAFSILENTHTLDADLIYKDFKELIVELGYFEKEELSDHIPQILQFPVPDIGSGGYPNRVLDKKENEFGTQLHSKKDYEANIKNTLAALMAASPELTEPPEGAENGENENSSLRSNGPFGGEMSTQIANLAQTSLSSSINLSTITDVSPSTYTFEPSDNPARGAKTGEVEINGVTYETWWQTKSTCTLYSFAFIATAYTGNPYTDYVMVNGVLINKDREGQGPENEYWTRGGGCGPVYFEKDDITGTTYSSRSSDYGKVAEDVSKGLDEGKPVYFYGDLGASGGYHAIVLLGANSGGKIIYFDPGGGVIREYGTSSSFPANLKSLLENHWKTDHSHCIFVPDEAPKGVSKGDPFEGYEGGEAVVSPVTGILLEYGTYDKDLEEDEGYRKNSDKQEEVDEVGYAKILVLNEEISDQLVTCTNLKHKKAAREQGETIPDGIVSVTLPNEEPEEKLEDLSDIQKALYGYSLFAQDYENGSIGGYLIYIDGFKCELPGAVESEDNTDAELGSGVVLSKEKFLSEAASGTTQNTFNDCDYQETKYEADKVYKLLSETKEKQQKAKAKAKELAAPLYKFNGSINGVEQEMLVIKEGTVIGRTFSNEELVEDLREQTYTSESDEEVQGNYLRIIMRDLDDSVVENVEDYMKLDEGGIRSVNQEYKSQPGDLQLLANLLHHEGCEGYFARILGSEELGRNSSRVTGYVCINRALCDYGNYGTTIKEQIEAPGQYETKDVVINGPDVSCDLCLANAEWCLKYDCSSTTNPEGDPMPREVLGQSGWCQCNGTKFNCWWWVDTNRDGQHTEYTNRDNPFDTFYCK